MLAPGPAAELGLPVPQRGAAHPGPHRNAADARQSARAARSDARTARASKPMCCAARTMAFFWIWPKAAAGVRQYAEARRQDRYGLKVLNLFAYTCAFSVVALQGGAKQVVNVDMSHGAMATGQQNHQLNGITTGRQLFGARHLQQLGQDHPQRPYGLVIVDPPSYQKGSFVATKDYARLMRRLPDLLRTRRPRAAVPECARAGHGLSAKPDAGAGARAAVCGTRGQPGRVCRCGRGQGAEGAGVPGARAGGLTNVKVTWAVKCPSPGAKGPIGAAARQVGWCNLRGARKGLGVRALGADDHQGCGCLHGASTQERHTGLSRRWRAQVRGGGPGFADRMEASASCISRFHAPAFLHVPLADTTRARLTLLFGGTAVATGPAVGLLADELLTRQLTDLSGQSLMNSSQPIALALAQGMQEREREISLLSHLPNVDPGLGLRPATAGTPGTDPASPTRFIHGLA